MTRSIGVTVIAVLSLVGSLVAVLMGLLVILVTILRPHNADLPTGMPSTFMTALLVLASLTYVLPAIWGIFTSIGLFRLKSWARLSIIAFSVLLIFMSGFAALISLIVPFPSAPNNPIDTSVARDVRIVMGLFWTSLAGIGIWWLVFFTRTAVKQQFLPLIATPPDVSVGQVPIVQTTSAMSERPLSLTIIGWWMVVVGSLFIPWSLMVHAPAMVFLKVVTGWPAFLFNLVLAGIHLYVGIGLLRLKPATRVIGIAYFAYALVNGVVIYAWPGARARMSDLVARQQSIFPWMEQLKQSGTQVDFTPFLVIGTCLGLVVLLVPLYFLITRRQAFEKSAIQSA